MTPDMGFRHFHDQLGTLKQRLLEMSQRAEELVELSVEALLTRDREKAEAVIAGDRDMLIPLWKSEEVAEHIDDATVTVLRGIGHAMNMERVDEFNDAVIGWLTEQTFVTEEAG